MDADDYSVVKVLPDHGGTILNAKYIDEYGLLITSSADLKLQFWEIHKKYNLRKEVQVDCSQTVIDWCSKNQTLYTASRLGELSYWKWQKEPDDRKKKCNFAIVNKAKIHDDSITDILNLPSENNLVTCSLDSTILLIDLMKNVPKVKLRGHNRGVFSVTWSEDYHFLVSAGFEHEPLVWIANVDTKPFRLQDNRKPHQYVLIGVHAVPKTPQIITADAKGMIKIWDM